MKKESIVLGIDFGMTNCCVAVPGGRKAGGMEIITDGRGRQITPTAVGEDEKGSILVGHEAKKRAGLQPPPIFFIKRYMGTDMKFELQGRGWTPEEVSAEILKTLKSRAEKFLESDVSRAVITVPGYFGIGQKLAMERAAKLAGFDEVELLLEPIAITLGYGLQEGEGDRRILVYDLGAVAFDVTVLEKRENDFRILASGGDSFLGGHDFDRALANFLLAKLKEKGYNLGLNVESEEDNKRFAKLVDTAEEAKVALTGQNEARIKKPSLLTDHDGRNVDIDITLSRSEFDNLISEKVDETIEHCRSTIEKAGLYVEEIDEVIMAGGGCYVPLVPQSIQKAFNKKPRFKAPETCVVRGAALYAGLLTPPAPGLILYPIPTETPDNMAVIGGKIEPKVFGEGFAVSEAKVVLLREEDNFRQSSTLTESGDFIFEDVTLLENTKNRFTLYLEDNAGNNLLSHSIKISHRPDAEEEAEAITIPQSLSRPVSVKLEGGIEMAIKDGTPLPQSLVFSIKTKDQSEKIDIPILEGENEIGKIVVKNLNSDLPTGTPIEITLELKEDYSIDAHAYLPLIGQTVEVEVIIPPLHVSTLKELKQYFVKIKGVFKQELERIGDSDLKLQYEPRSRELIGKIKVALSEIPVDIFKLSVLLNNLNNLLSQIKSIEVLEPGKDIFEKKISKALGLAGEKAKQYKKIRKEDYPQLIQSLKEEGDEAYRKKDQTQWEDLNARIDMVIENLYAAVPEPELSAGEIAPQLQKKLLSQIRELSLQARQKKMGEEILKRITQLQDETLEIDLRADPEKAIAELEKLHQSQFVPLRTEITGEHTTAEGNPQGSDGEIT